MGHGGRGPISTIIHVVGTGVDMAVQYREHRKEKSQAHSDAVISDDHNQPQVPIGDEGVTRGASGVAAASTREFDDAPPAYNDEGNPSADTKDADTESIYDDQEVWELDDAVPDEDGDDTLPPYEDVDELVKSVVMTAEKSSAVVEATEAERPGLTVPIIIPQRRPRKKSRGFVRAYAPALDPCGINQETFLRFLKAFHTTSQASPYFTTISIAACPGGLAPSVVAMAVSAATVAAARSGKEGPNSSTTNTFLDRMNEELFKPAGLFAMIVKYKYQEPVVGLIGAAVHAIHSETTNMSTTAPLTDTSLTSGRLGDLHITSDATDATASLPASAPLIFPDLDRKAANAGPETFKDKSKDAKNFLADYFDRRAQMSYAVQDPNSSLTRATSDGPSKTKKSYTNIFADPDHPMYSGGFIALLSGGKLTPRQDYRRRRDLRRQQRLHGLSSTDGEDAHVQPESSKAAAATYQANHRRQHAGLIRRVLIEDVLYLLIVNMPSEQELEVARQGLAARV